VGFLLDTNIISTHLKRTGLTFSKFTQHAGQLYTSQIVVGELYVWCWASSDPHRRRSAADALLAQIPPLPFDSECAWKFGELRSALRAHDIADLMIAATALVHQHIVVSHDRHFQAIQAVAGDLEVVDWLDGVT
jgi:predicted nucleic acid-binding protein